MQTNVESLKGKSPREVWIASFTSHWIKANSYGEIVRQILDKMKGVSSYDPDIICLPEAFAQTKDSKSLLERAEGIRSSITGLFTEFAKCHKCYIICPLYVREEDQFYNSAIIIDRKGNMIGQYNKIHPTEEECDAGITPGNSPPPVFKTDFGKIGIQICFDINWPEEWRNLKKGGAEIVFWVSAYPDGRLLSSYACCYQYYVIGCPREDPSLVFDISGDLIANSGRAQHYVITPINLEKVLCEVDFNSVKIPAIMEKYGRKVKIKRYHDEDWFTIESLSPDLTINHIIQEFNLVPLRNYIARADRYQKKLWTERHKINTPKKKSTQLRHSQEKDVIENA